MCLQLQKEAERKEKKHVYEMRISQVQEEVGSMEKAEYITMFQLFMSMTFRLDLRRMKLLSAEVFSMAMLMKSLHLMCFLTRDEGELRKCNDFKVRFVYTTATPTESRANETGIVLTSGYGYNDKAYILECCREIMAYDSNLETQK